MKVGNLVRRKPNAVTNQPETLGLVTEMFDDASAINSSFPGFVTLMNSLGAAIEKA